MALTIESLLDENKAQVEQLLAAAEAAHGDVTAIDELSERIEERFQTSSSAAMGKLSGLHQSLSQLESNFNHVKVDTGEMLQAAETQFSEAQQRALMAVKQVTEVAAAANGRISTTGSQLEEQLGSADSQLRGVVAGAEEFRTSIDTTLDKSKAGAGDFQGKVDAALVNLEQNRSTATSNIESLKSDAQQELDAVVESLDKGIEDTQQKLDDTLAATQSVVDSSSENMNQKISDDGLQTITEQLKDVTSSLELVTDTAGKLGLDFGDSLDGVMGNIEEIVALAEKINLVLKFADDVL